MCCNGPGSALCQTPAIREVEQILERHNQMLRSTRNVELTLIRVEGCSYLGSADPEKIDCGYVSHSIKIRADRAEAGTFSGYGAEIIQRDLA